MVTDLDDSYMMPQSVALAGKSRVELLDIWLGSNLLGYSLDDFAFWESALWMPIGFEIAMRESSDCVYVGPIYRAIVYNSSSDGAVFPMERMQSWSKDFESLGQISKFHKGGEILVVEGYVDSTVHAIDLNKYLESTFKSYNQHYTDELEIVAPISKDMIVDVYRVDMIIDSDGKRVEKGESLPKDSWYRDDFPTYDNEGILR